MAKGTVRDRFDNYLSHAEVAVYSILSILLLLTIATAIASSGKLLWDNLRHWTMASQTLQVLNELLIVLMLVEILHTLRISIRSHILVTEPFLVIGLIASVRRILVLSLEMTTAAREGESIFRASMIELGLLGILVLIMVVSITLLRRYPEPKDMQDI